MLRDADELTVDEKVEAAVAQDPMTVIAGHLGCEPDVESIAAELARLVEFSDAAEALAEELGLDAREARETQMYVDAVRELNDRVEFLESRATLGEILSEAFNLSRLSMHLVSESADPITALKREVQLSLPLAFPQAAPPGPSLLDRLAFHLGPLDEAVKVHVKI